MAQELIPDLRAIYELEMALGNTLVRIDDSSPFPLAVYLKEPLHRAKIESELTIAPPIQWHSYDVFAGYVCDNTQQSVKGPVPHISELAQNVIRKLSSNLRSIYDLELALGNEVVHVYEPAGDRCPLEIIFKKPLHKAEIASRLKLGSDVTWWENRDPHYSIESGYMCEQTRHALAGPLR
ncbi:MAG TPA: hypothetical protein P5296_17265 [Anaerohalosphaeraceae bacterium]|jgi:hypothetical protein|nr:hypothetical protein [Anaerohalosphaeraceae bacterium]